MHKTVLNMTTKHNPVTLPINMCAMGTQGVQPLDLTKLGDYHSVQHMPQKEETEFSYTSNQIVCVKDEKRGSEIIVVLACLWENARVVIKKNDCQRFCSRSFEVNMFLRIFSVRNTLRKRAIFVS